MIRGYKKLKVKKQKGPGGPGAQRNEGPRNEGPRNKGPRGQGNGRPRGPEGQGAIR